MQFAFRLGLLFLFLKVPSSSSLSLPRGGKRQRPKKINVKTTGGISQPSEISGKVIFDGSRGVSKKSAISGPTKKLSNREQKKNNIAKQRTSTSSTLSIKVVKRGPKTVTIITPLAILSDSAESTLKMLKSKLSTGGTRFENCIELQGSHEDRVKELLNEKIETSVTSPPLPSSPSKELDSPLLIPLLKAHTSDVLLAKLLSSSAPSSILPSYTGLWNPLHPGISISSSPFLPPLICDNLVALAETFAESKGWGSRYTYSTSAQELEVGLIPEARPILAGILRDLIIPSSNSSDLCLYNALIVKYEGKRSSMPSHEDFGTLTFNIALNDPKEFKGGGTWFGNLNDEKGVVVMEEKGQAIIHDAGMIHSGIETTEGTRYILAVFLMSSSPDYSGRLAAKGAKLRNSGNLKQAIEHLKMSTEIESSAANWYQLGLTFQRAGDTEEAVRSYQKAVAAGKLEGYVDFNSLFNLGVATKDPTAAEEVLREAVAVGAPPGLNKMKRDMDAKHNWGVCLVAMRRYEEAGLIFESIVTATEGEGARSEVSWASLGYCLAKLGQDEAATICQRKVEEIKMVNKG